MPGADVRSRPTFLHEFLGADPGTPEFGVARWLNARVGSREVGHRTRGTPPRASAPGWTGPGIDAAVMVARAVPGGRSRTTRRRRPPGATRGG